MKKYLFLLFLGALGACQDENEVVYSVDPALASYVDKFYAEAAEHGVTIPKNLIAEFSGIQSTVQVDTDHGQNYLLVHPRTFKTLSVNVLEVQIYSRLAGLFLKRSPSDQYSFMNGDLWTSYNPADKEMLFDELFVDNP